MSHRRIVAGEIARAIAFLSRIPVPGRFFVGHDGRLSLTVAAFPAAGLIIALPSAILIGLLGHTGNHAALVGLIAIALQILVIGALHEDGLADCADGLGGGRDREAALAIMKDSRIGAYGAIALILAVGLRTLALADMLGQAPPLAVAAALISAAGFSRAALVWHWRRLPSARISGVAAAAGEPDATAARIAYACGLALPLLVCGFFLPIMSLIAAMLVAGLCVTAFTAYVRGKLGGYTGDTLGAAQQVGEIAFLTSLAFLI